jgi:uncharacterized protein YciI
MKMKHTILIIYFLAGFFSLSAQTQNPDYDSVLARRLESDDYGMKPYVFVILKSGSNTLEQGPKRDSLFIGHLENIGRLADAGKLVIAGPLGKNENSYRGIFVLNVKTLVEAQELLKTDPAIKAGLLDTDLYEWYGSAAISEYLKVHKKIEKKSF